MGDTTHPRQVRIPEPLWIAYHRVCGARGQTRAQDILGHIRSTVLHSGQPEDLMAVRAADAELAERRSRRRGRPRSEEDR
jgi:hypothetical protein